MQVNQQRAEKLRDLQQENHQLSTLLLKVKAMNSWRRNHLTDNYLKTVGLVDCFVCKREVSVCQHREKEKKECEEEDNEVQTK